MDADRGDLTPIRVAHTSARLIATLAAASSPDGPAPTRAASVTDAVTAALGFDRVQRFRPVVQRALILLADHELASSTLAVRVAASVRSDPYACLTAGLGVLAGPLHGGAAPDARRFFVRCEQDGVAATVDRELAEHRPIPGWGHKVYRDDDPRWRPIVDAIPEVAATRSRLAVVHEATAVTGARLSVRPNVDWATGALAFIADLEPRSIELVMALSRMAGWTAHAIEEYQAPPVRFRGVSRYVPQSR
jgi:citrate synthase